MSGPVRTCIGCRERTAKSQLLRLVRRSAAVVADPNQTEPGRGAYVHLRSECLDQAVRRRAVGRALRIADRQPTFDEVRSRYGQFFE